jgi:predicted ArsR family transcriptional regulator
MGLDEESESSPSRVWVLAEPMRRAVYRYVAASRGQVSRDEAADALSIPRHVAKFHLDRLETAGLLDVEYRRPEGRSGPGAGRPTKWYRSIHDDLTASVPERHYDVMGEMLAAAIDAADMSGMDLSTQLSAAAEASGRRIGVAAQHAEEALAATGYEPRDTSDGVVLDNCPFHQLAERHTELVCGINLAFVRGMLGAVDDDQGYSARLDPCEGRCCVVLDRVSGR